MRNVLVDHVRSLVTGRTGKMNIDKWGVTVSFTVHWNPNSPGEKFYGHVNKIIPMRGLNKRENMLVKQILLMDEVLENETHGGVCFGELVHKAINRSLVMKLLKYDAKLLVAQLQKYDPNGWWNICADGQSLANV